MKSVVAAAVVAVAVPLASCGPSEPGLRLRHDPKRELVYEADLRETAEHQLIGLGGTMSAGSSFTMSCISREPDGSGHYEVTVRHVRASAPPAAGAAVDTALGRPVEGDRIGANAVVQSLLPRRALVVVQPDAHVLGAQRDEESAKHLFEWARTQPVASRKVVFRLAETLDAASTIGRWFGTVATLLPPNEHVPHGTSWSAPAPSIEIPAGKLSVTLDVSYRREGDYAVLDAKAAPKLEGEPPASRPVDFESATMSMEARIDVVRGVLVSYTEKGRFDLRLRGAGRLPAPWEYERTLRLTEVREAGAR